MLKSLYLVKNLKSNETCFCFSISIQKYLLLKEHSDNKNKLSVFGICTRTGNIRAVELVCVTYDVLCLEKIFLSLELLLRRWLSTNIHAHFHIDLDQKERGGKKKSACLSVLFYPRLVWMASSLFNTANSLILYKVTLNHALFEMKKNRTTWMAKWENCCVYFQNGYIISSSGSIRQHDQLMPLVKIHLKTVETCKPPRGQTQNCLFKRNDLN